jgi:hypothetical protein
MPEQLSRTEQDGVPDERTTESDAQTDSRTLDEIIEAYAGD